MTRNQFRHTPVTVVPGSVLRDTLGILFVDDARRYITDVKACLRLSDRDSMGRFVKGNKYRFRKTKVVVQGQPKNFLAQSAMTGTFFKDIG